MTALFHRNWAEYWADNDGALAQADNEPERVEGLGDSRPSPATNGGKADVVNLNSRRDTRERKENKTGTSRISAENHVG